MPFQCVFITLTKYPSYTGDLLILDTVQTIEPRNSEIFKGKTKTTKMPLATIISPQRLGEWKYFSKNFSIVFRENHAYFGSLICTAQNVQGPDTKVRKNAMSGTIKIEHFQWLVASFPERGQIGSFLRLFWVRYRLPLPCVGAKSTYFPNQKYVNYRFIFSLLKYVNSAPP